jgi:hypothetical protein
LSFSISASLTSGLAGFSLTTYRMADLPAMRPSAWEPEENL